MAFINSEIKTPRIIQITFLNSDIVTVWVSHVLSFVVKRLRRTVFCISYSMADNVNSCQITFYKMFLFPVVIILQSIIHTLSVVLFMIWDSVFNCMNTEYLAKWFVIEIKIRSPARAETDTFYCLEAPGSPQSQATGFVGLPGSKMLQFLYWRDFLILFHHFLYQKRGYLLLFSSVFVFLPRKYSILGCIIHLS